MVNERPEMLAKSATLYFGPWYRQSPFFKATLRAGCTAYDIYNHMPAGVLRRSGDRVSPAGERRDDVGRRRRADRADRRSRRRSTGRHDHVPDLSNCAVKQGKYMIDRPDGGIVNDPVLLHVDEDTWWMQLADSDAGLYAMGVAATSGLDVEVTFPDVHPMQVQGPLSAKTSRSWWVPRSTTSSTTGSTASTSTGSRADQPHGLDRDPRLEVNLLDGTKGDELWNAVAAAGRSSGSPIAPCEGRRGGIFNYGSDMTIADTPLHVMGLERLVEDQPQDYIGKAALEDPRCAGSTASSSGSSSRATSCAPRCPSTGPCTMGARRSDT